MTRHHLRTSGEALDVLFDFPGLTPLEAVPGRRNVRALEVQRNVKAFGPGHRHKTQQEQPQHL
eukprot:CAMPEP_0205831362 /NCGR_PEP_ID=MMETSP0206-20130828/43865_1 /ASSEMBLY_ACC=CAM_ASM_000279 /TAXON_ID=36767 /ORGANISM="Euplotes focardii, Strain TN1" /LENGTH=62 /DNA_ID=CAMNT_0053135921 /DNA_START=52 /DNA_END=240 /DNA_ORIENTATION=-